MSEKTQLRVALFGSGQRADEWAEAFSRAARVQAGTVGSADALVVAPGTHDPFGQTREALRAGVSVLFAASFQLTPWQASSLEELSRRERRLLRFVEPFRYQRGYSFLRRLLEGREPFWRPLYLRSLCLKGPQSGLRLDDLATEELALYDSLLGARPRCVSAVSVRQDESTQACAASIMVEYVDGPSLHCMVSLAEGSAAHELAAVAPERTVLMDQLDLTAPLRIFGTDADGRELSLARDDGEPRCDDIVAQETAGFLAAVRSPNLSYSNGGRWTRVAAVWWAARQSMSFGGSVEVPALVRTNTKRPPLTVIEGGGGPSRRAGPRPALKLIAG